MKTTTIKDIAAVLKLHHTTVSRALRDHPDVKPETKQQILRLAKKLNYKPNIIAQNLKSNRSNMIGVIVPEIMHHFFSAVISGIEEVAYKHNFITLVCQSNEDYDREIMNATALMQNKIAGLLVSVSQKTINGNHFKSYQSSGRPIVFFDRAIDKFKASKVVVDDYQGGFAATEHLIMKGYKKIAHIGGTPQLMISQHRFHGYKAALKAYGIPFRKQFVLMEGFHEKDGMRGMEKLLQRPEWPDAVLAVNDPSAVGIYDVLKKRNLKIPDNIAVIGFSNNPISVYLTPPLTTVDQPAYEIGKKSALMLLKEIEHGKSNGKYETLVLPTELIIREST